MENVIRIKSLKMMEVPLPKKVKKSCSVRVNEVETWDNEELAEMLNDFCPCYFDFYKVIELDNDGEIDEDSMNELSWSVENEFLRLAYEHGIDLEELDVSNIDFDIEELW